MQVLAVPDPGWTARPYADADLVVESLAGVRPEDLGLAPGDSGA